MISLILIDHAISAGPPELVAWLYGFVGWVVYNLYRMDEQSSKFDLDGDGYSMPEIMKYLKFSWIRIAISFLLVIVGVSEMPNIWGWLLPNYEFSNFSYMGAGFLSIGVQYIMDKYGKKA